MEMTLAEVGCWCPCVAAPAGGLAMCPQSPHGFIPPAVAADSGTPAQCKIFAAYEFSVRLHPTRPVMRYAKELRNAGIACARFELEYAHFQACTQGGAEITTEGKILFVDLLRGQNLLLRLGMGAND